MGHQYDIYPLARLVKEIGWPVTVISNPLKISKEILGLIDKVYDHDQFSEMTIDKYTAIILMSHDYKTDKMNLLKALSTAASYVGMLGPRVRAEKIFRELEEESKRVSD
jgi:xanthine/CO dehydrogenase XdhC/CoxF family maturation factor